MTVFARATLATLLVLPVSMLNAAPLPGQAGPTMSPAPASTTFIPAPGLRPAPAPTNASSGGGMFNQAAPSAPTRNPGAFMRAAGCPLANGPQVRSVNMRVSGVVFTPGGRYQIRGCNLGSAGGEVRLAAYRYSYGEMSVPLIVDSWSDTLIDARIDPDFGGVPDVAAVNVNVTPAGQREVGLQAANAFQSVKVDRTICLPIGLGKVVYGGGSHTRACDGEFSTISRPVTALPNGDYATPDTCAGAMGGRTDTYDLSEVKPRGFDLLGVTDGYGLTDSAIPYVTMNGPERIIVNLPTEWDTHFGGCMSIYHLGVRIRGPRGVDPYPDPVQNVD